MPISVAVIDDRPFSRAGAKSALSSAGEIFIAGVHEDASAAFASLLIAPADAALISMTLPSNGAVSLMRAMAEADLRTVPIILAHRNNSRSVSDMLRAGAKGFVLDSSPLETAVTAIKTAVAGTLFLDPDAERPLAPTPRSSNELISAREREVLLLSAKGLSGKEIAALLFISQRTVQTHMTSIFDKLHTRNKTEAMLAALKSGLFSIDDIMAQTEE